MRRLPPVLLWLTVLAAVAADGVWALGGAFQGRAGGAGAQTAALEPGTGLIMGQATDANGGSPIAGAIVTLSGGLVAVGGTGVTQAALPGGSLRTVTNGSGRFVFLDLPKGGYSIDISKPGYLSGANGRRRPGGPAQPLELADGERNGSLTIQLWKYATITGTVTDEAGEPVVGAEVWAPHRIVEAGRSHFQTAAVNIKATTDDRGMYRIATLTPGEYIVGIAATQSTTPAALIDAYEQAQQGGGTTPDSMRTLDVYLLLSGGINGPGTRVGDFVVRAADAMGRTGVAPGLTGDGRIFVYPTTFYPGTTTLGQAQSFTLASGEERSNVNIQLKALAAGHIAGMVVGPDGPVPNFILRLAPAYATDLTVEDNFDAGTTITDARGAFTFLGIPAGPYVIRALQLPSRAPAPNPLTTVIQTGSGTIMTGGGSADGLPAPSAIPQGQTLWASVPVTVAEGGISNLTVTLGTGFHVSGKLEWDGSAAVPPANVIRSLAVTLENVDGHTPFLGAYLRGQVDPAGQITTYAIPPGKYFVRVAGVAAAWQGAAGWTFKSAMLDGRDVSLTPLDLQGDVSGLVVTMTDHPSEIAGTARDAQGRGDGGAEVLIFPVSSAAWMDNGRTPRGLRSARATKDGAFKFTGLAPGEYFIISVPEEKVGDWQDPKILQTLAGTAQRMTLADGEKKSLDLRTSR